MRLRLLIEVNADGFYQGEVVRAIESHEPVRIETSGWGSPVNGVIVGVIVGAIPVDEAVPS